MTRRIVPAVALCMWISACGGTSGDAGPASRTTSSSTVARGATTSSSSAPAIRYLNDGDAEKFNDHDTDNSTGNHEDGDADSTEEYEGTYDNGRYHDSDDKSILDYGHAANAAQKKAIVAVVKRYFTTIVTGDDAGACSAMMPSLASSLPEDYGEARGPVYLRGGKTCPAVIALLLKHFHVQLSGTIHVTGVRVTGGQALALLGSTTMPASAIPVEHVGGTWRIGSLLGSALP